MQINDSKHEDRRFVDSVEHTVGKPARDSSPHLSVDDLVLHRVQTNAAEADALPFIPSAASRMSALACRLTTSR